MNPKNKKKTKKLFIAKNISKYYKYKNGFLNILNNTSISIKYGETIAITGASGIGKSTLLHILGTLDRPHNGKLLYKGKNIFNLDNTSLAKFRNRTIGFIFQFHHLLKEFSAIENTILPVLIGKKKMEKAHKIAKKLLIRIGMKDKMNHKIHTLSGGEQQRVAIARALIQNPKILLADEPTVSLDTKNSNTIHELLLDLNQKIGMALIIATHDSKLSSLMSRNITILNGKLIKNK